MMTATRSQTIAVLGYAAMGAYALALLLFVIGAMQDLHAVRDAGLALGLLGLALDMRHFTARGVVRLVHSMSLWQDYDGPEPQHRRDLPPHADADPPL
jgi:hypothetical protein